MSIWAREGFTKYKVNYKLILKCKYPTKWLELELELQQKMQWIMIKQAERETSDTKSGAFKYHLQKKLAYCLCNYSCFCKTAVVVTWISEIPI